MSNPIYITDQWQRDTITTKERMAQFAQEARTDEQHSMEMLVYVLILSITLTGCLLAWTLW